MNGKQSFTMSTKLDKSAASRNTVCTVNFDGATDAQITNLVLRQLRVDFQAQWRKDGAIPDVFKYDVKDHGTGRRNLTPTVDGTKAQYDALSDEDKKAFRVKMGIG